MEKNKKNVWVVNGSGAKNSNAAAQKTSRDKTDTMLAKGKFDRKLFFQAVLVNVAASIITGLFYWIAIGSSFEDGFVIDATSMYRAFAAFLVAFLINALVYFYLRFSVRSINEKIKNYIVFTAILTFNILLSGVLVNYLSVFFLTFLLTFLLLGVLFGLNAATFGFFAHALVFIFMAYFGGFSPFGFAREDLIAAVFFNAVATIATIFFSRKFYRRLNIVLAGLCAGLVTTVIAYLFYFFIIGFNMDYFENTGIYFILLSSILSVCLYFSILPILERTLDVVTDYRLAELVSLKNPLLKELKQKAPGTFHHCMVVATLAEDCAQAIGESTLLARAGAYYHDIGKIRSPEFFKENQKDDYNPHDSLTPEVSVSKIIAHTARGVALLKEKGFPESIISIVDEHHGTLPVIFFANKAKAMSEDKLEEQPKYFYANNKPKSKMAALIMICDATEAIVRSNPDADMNELVANIIKERMDSLQFSECNLTLKDLYTIQKTLVQAVTSMFHTRIKY